MSSRSLTYHVIICDGCGTLFGTDKSHETSGAAREAAIAAGWKLVPKVDSKGRPCHVGDNMARVGNRAKDACPTCAPDMKPQPWISGARSGNAWWMERIKRLEDENRRLRGA